MTAGQIHKCASASLSAAFWLALIFMVCTNGLSFPAVFANALETDHHEPLPPQKYATPTGDHFHSLQQKFDHILFHHFPKTGGTTLKGILHDHATQTNQSISVCYAVEHGRCLPNYGKQWPAFNPEQPSKFVLGHNVRFGFHENFGLKNVTYFTMLREPLGWLVSRYYWDLRTVEDMKPFTEDWGGSGYFWSAFSSYYGHYTIQDEDEAPTWEEVELIKAQLRDNFLVLLTERYVDSMRLLGRALGVPKSTAFKYYETKNAMRPVSEDPTLCVEVKDLKVIAKHLPKMEYLYSYAEHMFEVEMEAFSLQAFGPHH
eukprot:CAMPEP_0113942576 /NCGR_PEP_ID=MMETSP1339-20121228/8267_1 /TAXON_ID=94617 /ORGANISM="Fibrocapsa japonica" /LENGTH=314 /DNA_ID=CAMNT_0000947099 /DNA_START=81 /DNA_END=1025 /DNA_ORIENTATION=+ /assembly_acc=CAM_ASM_000762